MEARILAGCAHTRQAIIHPVVAFISRDKFIRALWMLGFEYVTQTGRAIGFWKGDGRFIEVPKAEEVDLDWARGELRRCEVTDEEIDDALR